MANPGDWEINDSRALDQGDSREWEVVGLVPSDEDGTEMDAFLEWFEDETGVPAAMVTPIPEETGPFRFTIRAEGLA